MSDTTSPRAIFTKELVRELNRLEAFAKLDFRIPGTSTRLDVYIASPVRAFVEVIFLNVPHPSVTQGLIQQAALIREQFGQEIVPMLVARGEGWPPSSTKELRDAGFFICNLKSRTTDSKSAVDSAKEIWNYLTHLPYQFKGIEIDRAPSTFPVAAAHRPSLATSFEIDDTAIAASIRPLRPAMRDHAPAESRRIEPHFDFPAAASLELLTEPTGGFDIFADVLVSLKSILSPDQFGVLEHELAAFSEEYRHKHYTACALRLGRTLEHVVYALAGAWGVPPREISRESSRWPPVAKQSNS